MVNDFSSTLLETETQRSVINYYVLSGLLADFLVYRLVFWIECGTRSYNPSIYFTDSL